MKNYFILLSFLGFFIGCSQSTSSPEIKESNSQKVINRNGFYSGYAIAAHWNSSSHRFERSGQDSTASQIRIIPAKDELSATISINGGERPIDVFLFPHDNYYIGNDKTSYAYFENDSTVVYGYATDSVNYNVIYASK